MIFHKIILSNEKIAITVLFSSVFCNIYFSQSLTKSSKFDNTINYLYDGLKESVEWYDVPIGLAYFARNSINPSNIGDKIIIAPSEFEKNSKLFRYFWEVIFRQY